MTLVMVRNRRSCVQTTTTAMALAATLPLSPTPSLASRSAGGMMKMLLSAMVVVALRATTTPLSSVTIVVAALVAASSFSSSSSSSASAAILGTQFVNDAKDPNGDKAAASTGSLKNFYSFTATDINGNTVHLSKYKGKVNLVVNIASECGFTRRNYEALVQMQRTFSDTKFTVLAFPCNQFGEQEPGDNWEIESFAEKLYNINFPLFSKTDIIGPNAASCWKYLTKSSGKEPNWNFWKYLVDGNGFVTNVWGPRTSFSEIYRTIQDVIEGKHKQKNIVHTDL